MSDLFKNMSEDNRSAAILDYVKGRAARSLRAQIEAAAKSDACVAEEIAYYKGLANSVQKPSDAAPFDELGWARLSQNIDREELTHAVPSAANDNGKVWRYATAALAFIAFGQATFFAFQNNSQNEQPTYETVGEVSVGYSLQVTFISSVTENEIRTLFQKAGANITHGPSALGIYEVSFADEAARAEAEEAFSAATEVVESVYKN